MGASRSAGLEDLNDVWEVYTLKGKPMESEARVLLTRVARQVKPILRRRGWRVLKLSEFSPRNKSLLGINVDRGREIRIRLRLPNSDLAFFPYEHVLGTMLHELAHMERGPHDAKFYALLDDLREECEALMAQEIMRGAPEAFEGAGHRLGGYSSAAITPAAAAAAAAARRWGKPPAFPLGPQRLGGDRSMMRALSPVQAAAMAAERRLHDDSWCGGDCAEGGAQAREGGAQAREGGNNTGERSSCEGHAPEQRGSCAGRRGDAEHSKPKRITDDSAQQAQQGTTEPTSLAAQCQTNPPLPAPEPGSDSDDVVILLSNKPSQKTKPGRGLATMAGDLESWSCSACTFRNLGLVQCEMCGAARPRGCSEDLQATASREGCRAQPKGQRGSDLPAGVADRHRVGKRKADSEQLPVQEQSWECQRCTLLNASVRDRCEACDLWRYYRGRPVADSPLHMGT